MAINIVICNRRICRIRGEVFSFAQVYSQIDIFDPTVYYADFDRPASRAIPPCLRRMDLFQVRSLIGIFRIVWNSP